MPKPLSNPLHSDYEPVDASTLEQGNHAPSLDSADLDSPSEKVWDQFAELFDLIEEMAKNPPSAEEFYQRLLAETVAGFAAVAGRAWLPTAEGGFRLLSQVGPMPAKEHQVAHEQMLAEATHSKELSTKVIGSHSVTVVQVEASKKGTLGFGQPEALIELVQRTDCPEELYRSTERLLEAISQVAADFHRQQQNQSLEEEHRFQQSLLSLAQQVAGDLRVGPTSYRIVNNCRQLLHADRVSLIRLAKGALVSQHARLLAVSGVDEVDKRSASTRSLMRFAKMVGADRRAMRWSTESFENHETDFPEECLDQLDAYADKSHVKALIAVPLFAPHKLDQESATENDVPPSNPLTQGNIEAVLIVESFNSRSIEATSEQLQMAAQVCAPALDSAIKTPFASVQNLLSRWLVPKRLLAFITLLATLLGLAYAATVIEVEHTVTLRGTVQANKQSELYAPTDARVARTLVEGGDQVSVGQPLLELRDARSLLELQQLEGELLAAERQHDSISATRMSLNRSSVAPTETLRLAAEQERLALRRDSLKKEIGLVTSERKRLVVVSPLSGMITTWQLDDLLVNRPVKRGQRLLTVVDAKAGWKIELDFPDDRLGILHEAEALSEEPIQVVYELASDPSVLRRGKIVNYSPIAEDATGAASTAQRIIRLEVLPDDELVNEVELSAPLAGVSVRAEVQCGKRSVAYVALHDIWHFLSTKWELGW